MALKKERKTFNHFALEMHFSLKSHFFSTVEMHFLLNPILSSTYHVMIYKHDLSSYFLLRFGVLI